MLRQGSAVTLIEIMVVVVIIGILAALALPNFGTMRERAVDREAMANLKLLQAAEKIYRMEATFFYDSIAPDTTNINTNLRLDLSPQNWNYTTDVSGGNLDARATRQSPPAGWNRNFFIDQAEQDACCCPIGGTGVQCPTYLECDAADCP